MAGIKKDGEKLDVVDDCRTCPLAWMFAASASPQIHHWTMANGARAYFVETHQIPMVQFAVGFDAGSARDPGSLKGVANFVNEMVEEGTADMDGALVAEATGVRRC